VAEPDAARNQVRARAAQPDIVSSEPFPVVDQGLRFITHRLIEGTRMISRIVSKQGGECPTEQVGEAAEKDGPLADRPPQRPIFFFKLA